jgi:hypothetical protein
LERELSVVVKNRDDYEDMMQSESQQQGRDLHLEGSQIKEYHKLKEKAGKESARYLGELDSINREQKSDQVTLESFLTYFLFNANIKLSVVSLNLPFAETVQIKFELT